MANTSVTQRQVETSRGPWAFAEAGDGSPLVFIPGEIPGASGIADYAANIAAFSRHFRTLLLDAPPRRSTAAAGGGAARGDGRTLLELLDALNIEHASLAANGDGAATAAGLALLAPERVDRLVLIGPTGCAFSPFTPPPNEGLKAVAAYWREPSVKRMRDVAGFLFTNEGLRTDDFVEARHATAAGLDPSLQPDATSIDPAADLTLVAHLIRVPALIAWGREDRFSPLDYGLNLAARFKDAQFHMFPRCGHWPHYEKADEFNALALDFLTFDG